MTYHCRLKPLSLRPFSLKTNTLLIYIPRQLKPMRKTAIATEHSTQSARASKRRVVADAAATEHSEESASASEHHVPARPSVALLHSTQPPSYKINWQTTAPFLVDHPVTWDPETHFGYCGQSCGCCRSHNPEDACEGCNCQPCFTAWVLSCVSRSTRAATHIRAAEVMRE